MIVAHAGGVVIGGGDVFAGIDRAAKAGVPMVELDVRRTGDEVLVVHHGGRPGERTLAAQRRGELSGSIPLLSDVLTHVAGRLAVDLELKEAGYEDDVVQLALEYVRRERLVVTSFLDEAVRAVRSVDPEIATGLVVGRRPSLAGLAEAISDLAPFGRVRTTDADFLAPSHLLDNVAIRARAASRGIPLLVWTVNEKKKLEAALSDRRLLGVVTDQFELTGG
jgi:glycerophosphoryl diester phosphodiesterase